MFVWMLTLLTLVAHLYLWARLLRPWARGRLAWAAGLGTLASAVGLPLLLIFARHETPNAFRPLALPVFLWLGFLLVLFLLALAAEPARLALGLLARRGPGEADGVDHRRRRLISGAISAGVTAGAGGATTLGLLQAMGPEHVERVEIPMGRLPAALDGYTLVQLSDLHIGTTRGPAWLDEVVDRVNALAPRAVVITGDLVDAPLEIVGHEVAPLRRLRAPDGVFFVTGNHEHHSGADAWAAHLSRLGVRVLRNTRAEIGPPGARLDLAGVEDPSGARRGHPPDLAAALAGRSPRRPLILLAHRPRAVLEAARHGVDLVLAGHTHGGQIWPLHYLVGLNEPYLAGLARHDDTYIYVNRGTGFWGPPLRLGSFPEITHLTLRLKQSSTSTSTSTSTF